MDLIKQISSKGLVLDGAMSTALEKQGIDTNTDLWTAVALDKDLDKVYKVHMNYFQAGAQMAITDTYQANVQAFEKHGYSEDKAKEMIADAVKIAKKARDDFEKKTGFHNYVAASVGSYGAYLAEGDEFRGDYDLTKKQYLDFHLPRLQVLLQNKPDCLAIETQPKLDEVVVLLDWLKENAPEMPVYVSFTLHDTTKISDGTPLKKVMEKINEYDLTLFIRDDSMDGLFRKFEETHFQRCYEPDLIEKLLRQAGFSIIEAFDAYTDEPVDSASEKITFMGKK